MILNIVILVSVCCVALWRPLLGIFALLILETSLFNLGPRFASVTLPVGYASSADVLLFAILIGAWLSVRPGSRVPHSIGAPTLPVRLGDRSSAAIRRVAETWQGAIVPYVAWIFATAAFAFLFRTGFSSTSVMIRGAMDNLLPWTLVASIWLVRHQRRQILAVGFVVAGMTAVVHLGIQFFDIRSVMLAAYFNGIASDALRYQTHTLSTADVFRGLPQGVVLMTYTMIFCFASMLTHRDRSRWLYGAMASLQFTALSITITRSLLATSVVGFLCAFLLAARFGLLRRSAALNAFVAVICVVGAALLSTVLAPRYYQQWLLRIDKIDKDSAIFSQTTIRGLNNLSSLDAIRDHPLSGYGASVYPREYSRSVTGYYHHDIHPLLGVALAGGLIALALLANLLIRITNYCWQACRRKQSDALRLLPYLSIVLITYMINSIGAGGTLGGRGLMSMALFLGLLAAELAAVPAQSTIAGSGRYRTPMRLRQAQAVS